MSKIEVVVPEEGFSTPLPEPGLVFQASPYSRYMIVGMDTNLQPTGSRYGEEGGFIVAVGLSTEAPYVTLFTTKKRWSEGIETGKFKILGLASKLEVEPV